MEKWSDPLSAQAANVLIIADNGKMSRGIFLLHLHGNYFWLWEKIITLHMQHFGSGNEIKCTTKLVDNGSNERPNSIFRQKITMRILAMNRLLPVARFPLFWLCELIKYCTWSILVAQRQSELAGTHTTPQAWQTMEQNFLFFLSFFRLFFWASKFSHYGQKTNP